MNMGFTISASLHDCDILGGMNLVKKSVWFFFCLFFATFVILGVNMKVPASSHFATIGCNLKVLSS